MQKINAKAGEPMAVFCAVIARESVWMLIVEL